MNGHLFRSFQSVLNLKNARFKIQNRKNDKYTESIESLLESHEDWGHQFSEDDLKDFANELGLDYVMESKREEYDDVV